MVVAVFERQLKLDSAEERGRRVEDELVRAGIELGAELGDPPVVVRLAGADEIAVAHELHAHTRGRLPGARVEHVCGE